MGEEEDCTVGSVEVYSSVQVLACEQVARYIVWRWVDVCIVYAGKGPRLPTALLKEGRMRSSHQAEFLDAKLSRMFACLGMNL